MTSISPDRIRQIEARRDELSALMATGDLPSDRFVQVSKEYAELEPVAQAAGEVRRLRAEAVSLRHMVCLICRYFLNQLISVLAHHNGGVNSLRPLA